MQNRCVSISLRTAKRDSPPHPQAVRKTELVIARRPKADAAIPRPAVSAFFWIATAASRLRDDDNETSFEAFF
jgi:hypothetical protein